jgi:transcription-repair coupling factor (superfamily II helicase)
LKQASLLHSYQTHPKLAELHTLLSSPAKHLKITGLIGSSTALTAAGIFEETGKQQHIIVMPDKEQAAYLYNDLESIFEETGMDVNRKKVLFYPTSYKRPYEPEKLDRSYQLSRTEVLKRFMTGDRKTVIVTYPEALTERVITKNYLSKNIMKLKQGEKVSFEFVSDLLMEFEFESVEFVAEPGQFAIRGGIVDVFSFSNDHPYRIEFFGDTVESIRTFDPVS